jgi:hypothetical protein
MRTLNPLQNAPFPRLDRVIRNQRWLMTANAFVTFALLVGTFGGAVSLVFA